jgi:hypothetical protein
VRWSSKWAVLNRLEEAHYETSNGMADLESSINVVLEDIEEQNITMKDYERASDCMLYSPLTATRSATPMIYDASRGTPPMTKHTSIYLDSASRRQRGLLSTRTPSGQAATKIGLAVDQRGVADLVAVKGVYGPRRGRSNACVTCPHCKKIGHIGEGCWSLHPELASEHLQEKFSNGLES